ncbi:MAG: 4Fe-4S dicluster domain-containing protein [Desulfobacterales bacterium]|nr:4Fe-4S dicluster domain-containing protein [Desulfobacterales bacterium]MBF0396228.1 4Fe-4S dicluster domain-containing protein [Desulfobacterales bacterium]
MDNNQRKLLSGPVYIDTKPNHLFSAEVAQKSHVDFNLCYHCRCCGNGCPFVEMMDFPPNSIIRLVQLGLKKEALGSSTIWICAGCHTCSMQCPMAIDMAAIMDSLRQISLEEKAKIGEPDVLAFHKEVLNSIERYGRTSKLDIMLRYKIKTRNLFSDFNVGLKMITKRKLNLIPSIIKGIEKFKELFKGKRNW